MKQMFRQGLAILMAVMLVVTLLPLQTFAVAYDKNHGHESLNVRFWEDKAPDVGFYINAASRYILETVDEPEVGSTFGEWSVMDLLRGQYTGYDYINHIPSNYYDGYIKRMEKHVADNKGILDHAKSTEWSRVMLALSSLGYDVYNVVGYNFPEHLSKSFKFSQRQGINGPIWEIIAMNTGNYSYSPLTIEDSNSDGKMIDYVLKLEVTGGGWSLYGPADPDITGMALQAFAPYYLNPDKYKASGATISYTDFKLAVERALVKLAELQKPTGAYHSWQNANAESTVQVLVALTALKMDPLASSISLPTIGKTVSFVTSGGTHDGVYSNNIVDALLAFWAPNSGISGASSGFKHVTSGYDGGGGSGIGVNAMATDQALYGLIAYDRFKKGLNSLYDMTDMIDGQYKNMTAKSLNITFDGNNVVDTTTTTSAPYGIVTMPNSANVANWNTTKDGTGTRYELDDELIMPEHAITLYAQSLENTTEEDMLKVNEVIALINDLPSQSALQRKDAAQVQRVRGNYNKLNTKEKQLVTNYSTLVSIEVKLNQILNEYDDELRLVTLIRTIDDLYTIAPLTIDYQIAVENARRAYNALSASERLQVTNLYKLQELEAKMAVLIELNQDEHEEAINNGGVPERVAEEIKKMIAALPSIANLKREDALEVTKARLYYDSLTKEQQPIVDNYNVLVALEKQMQKLIEDALTEEEFEDDTDYDSYQEVVVKGDKLLITTTKSAAEFKVVVPQHLINNNRATTINVSDKRGVTWQLDGATVRRAMSKADALSIELSQYDYDSSSFNITLETVTKDKATALTLPKSFVQVFVPYTFFIDGKNLNKLTLFKQDGDSIKTIPHKPNNKGVLMHVQRGETLWFGKQDATFTDIAALSNRDEVLALAERQIIKGRGDGTFGPNESITRAQFATMISRALGVKPEAASSSFADVKGTAVEQDVQALYEAGIIRGVNATTFNPQGKLTRQQAAVMMARTLRYTGFDTNDIKPSTNFVDVNKIGQEALHDVGVLNTLGIMSGSSAGFRPADSLTRAQMAKLLKRTLNIVEML